MLLHVPLATCLIRFFSLCIHSLCYLSEPKILIIHDISSFTLRVFAFVPDFKKALNFLMLAWHS
jgi:hypothetical protein